MCPVLTNKNPWMKTSNLYKFSWCRMSYCEHLSTQAYAIIFLFSLVYKNTHLDRLVEKSGLCPLEPLRRRIPSEFKAWSWHSGKTCGRLWVCWPAVGMLATFYPVPGSFQYFVGYLTTFAWSVIDGIFGVPSYSMFNETLSRTCLILREPSPLLCVVFIYDLCLPF